MKTQKSLEMVHAKFIEAFFCNNINVDAEKIRLEVQEFNRRNIRLDALSNRLMIGCCGMFVMCLIALVLPAPRAKEENGVFLILFFVMIVSLVLLMVAEYFLKKRNDLSHLGYATVEVVRALQKLKQVADREHINTSPEFWYASQILIERRLGVLAEKIADLEPIARKYPDVGEILDASRASFNRLLEVCRPFDGLARPRSDYFPKKS